MRLAFIYLLFLIITFRSGVATELPLLCLVPYKSRPETLPVYAHIESQNHASVRQQLTYLPSAAHDYAQIQRADGCKELVPKKQTPNCQPSFKLDVLNSYVSPSAVRRLFGHDYEHDWQFFANDFAGNPTEHVFHCVLNYQYPGFCQYAQQLPGFDDFILSMTQQLKAGSELQKRMTGYWGGQAAFAALQQIYKTKAQARAEREWQAQRQVARQWLQAQEFDQQGISILESCHMVDQFVYHGNMVQMAQLKQIARLFNDIGAFQQDLGQVVELQQLVGHATGLGCLSNQANRNHNLSLSQACLEIGQNILALGRGLKDGVVRNGTNLYHMLRYPIDTAESLGQLVKNIGIGIGKVALTLSKHELGLEVGNEHLMHAAQQDVEHWICGGRQLYELAKQTWQNKSKLERYELVGNYVTDLLLLKGLPQAGKLAGIKNLAAYKPQAFTKLGEIGREINQIAGLTCAKGVKTIEQNLEIIRIYPQIVQSKQLSSEAVLYSNKCLKASKHYLRKLGKYATKCAINKEQRLVKSGDQVKKMPKACIAKTKQLIGGEIVVTDALGNIWHSKKSI